VVLVVSYKNINADGYRQKMNYLTKKLSYKRNIFY